MSIRLELTAGSEEWEFNLSDVVLPEVGDHVTIADADDHRRDFRVVGRRLVLSKGEPLDVVGVGVDLDPA